MKETFTFVWKLAVLSPVLYVVPFFGIELAFLREIITAHTFSILTALGFAVKQEGTLLFLGSNAIAITRDCVPWKVMLFFASLLVVSSFGLKRKALALMSFIPFIYFYNLGRIIALSYSSLFSVAAFDVLHFIFQLVSIGVTLGFWMFWMKKTIS